MKTFYNKQLHRGSSCWNIIKTLMQAKHIFKNDLAAVYTSCTLIAPPLLSHTVHTPPSPPCVTSVLHNCGDSCQVPAGTSDTLSPFYLLWSRIRIYVPGRYRGAIEHYFDYLREKIYFCDQMFSSDSCLTLPCPQGSSSNTLAVK